MVDDIEKSCLNPVFFKLSWFLRNVTLCNLAQSAGGVEYAEWFTEEGLDSFSECPEYDTNESDGMSSVMQELWGMKSTPSLPLLPGPL